MQHIFTTKIMSKIIVSVVGASGYSGIELVKILLKHSQVSIDQLFANSSAGKRIDEVYPFFKGRIDARYESYDVGKVLRSDLVFIALPSGEAMTIVPELIRKGKRVIDLGGDYRLKNPNLYAGYYGHEHSSPEFLSEAIYGLPEWNKSMILNAQLIANPGCYPTSILLPLLPLLKEGLIANQGITVSSMSGVSGAGRKASIDLSFAEVNETVKAYKVGNHQHIPEITSILETATDRKVGLTFIPHLIPITRGIYTTITAPTNTTLSDVSIMDTYQKYYHSSPFVRYSQDTMPEIKNILHTNIIDIGFKVNTGNNNLILCSVIDNLIKGAAGQAVQNMNLMFGYNETEGLK